MDQKINKRMFLALLGAASLSLTACGQSSQQPAAEPADPPPPVASKSLSIDAPAGDYTVDLNHAELGFSVMHMGLAPYSVHFRDYSAQLSLDPDNISQSSIQVKVNPQSIATGFVGDYKATHKDSKFSSWEEDLARSDRFLMADTHPEVGFSSNSVSQTADGKLQIDGDLTLRGQTHPLQLEVTVTGSTAKHPFTKKGAIGFVAVGHFKRSQYGMQFMQGPDLLGDKVTVRFQGEFHHQGE